MVEPEKPFACTMPDCGMTFTNEDHLNVHMRKHDMALHFGCEQKAAVFVADQTPTPTRFIRNCEEVGLFQDLQNVNPFDEGFKRAIETKQGMLTLEGCSSSEELHTPQMFPLLDGDSVYTATNNQRNITISRSSSDETGAIKEFETTRISKLTNEVTTISRIVEKHDDKDKETMKNSVSYTNNVIKIHSNVEIRKDTDIVKDVSKDMSKDTYEKDTNMSKDTFDRLQVDVPPIMSQKSIDFVVDSLTTDYVTEKTVKDMAKNNNNVKEKDVPILRESKEKEKCDGKNPKQDYEVILKLPSGQTIKLIKADEVKEKPKNAKDLLKKVITEKVETQKIINSMNIVPNVIPTISSGTLIPISIVNTNLVNTNLTTNLGNPTLVNTNLVTTNLARSSLGNTSLVNTNGSSTSIGNANLVTTNLGNPTLVATSLGNTNLVTTNLGNATLVTTNLGTSSLVNGINYTPKLPLRVFDKRPVRRKTPNTSVNKIESKKSKRTDEVRSNLRELESRSAASKRYRARLKETMVQQSLENAQLKAANDRLVAEKALLQTLIIDHMKRCHCPDDLRDLKEKIKNLDTNKHTNI